MSRSFLVVGGTGTVGRHVAAALSARGERVRVLTRDPARAAATAGPSGASAGGDSASAPEFVAGDLADPGALAPALAGVERVYLATSNGPEQPRLEIGLIDAAARAGVRRVVKLSGWLAQYPEAGPYGQSHATVEAHLAASPLAWTVLRPNWFMENFLGTADSIAREGAFYGTAGAGRVGFVAARDIAAVAVAALTGDGHAGRTYHLTGPGALTFAEAAAQIGAGLGRPVRYVDLPEPAYREALGAAGVPPEIIALLTGGYAGARGGLFEGATTAVADVAGAPARSLAEFARDYAGAFGAPPSGAAAAAPGDAVGS